VIEHGSLDKGVFGPDDDVSIRSCSVRWRVVIIIVTSLIIASLWSIIMCTDSEIAIAS
jgi:hypothetical protein